ncbi:hypothetical protein Csa_008177 [Cucumis sativus]|nr:hypothetical protein Csa_008177 [Cucumis sativus]
MGILLGQAHCNWTKFGVRPLSTLLKRDEEDKVDEIMAQTSAIPLAHSLSLISNSRNFNPLSNTLSFPISNPQVRGLQIKCVRVGGVEIPNNKRVQYSLQYVHGIGRNNAKKILFDLNVRRFNALAIRRIERNSVLSRDSTHSGVALQRAANEKQLQNLEGCAHLL